MSRAGPGWPGGLTEPHMVPRRGFRKHGDLCRADGPLSAGQRQPALDSSGPPQQVLESTKVTAGAPGAMKGRAGTRADVTTRPPRPAAGGDP